MLQADRAEAQSARLDAQFAKTEEKGRHVLGYRTAHVGPVQVLSERRPDQPVRIVARSELRIAPCEFVAKH